jgi:hypothetical protein
MQRKSTNWVRATFSILFLAGLVAGGSALSAGHSVTDFTLSPATPNILNNNKYVTVTFSYTTTEPGGVIIFARPMTGDSMPDYAASNADVSATGKGSVKQFFTVRSGNATVDRIRIQMFNADQSKLLLESYLPVHYEFQQP